MACTLQLYTDKIDAFLQLYMYSRTPETVVLTRCGTDGTDKACSQRCRHFEIIFEKTTDPISNSGSPLQADGFEWEPEHALMNRDVVIRLGGAL